MHKLIRIASTFAALAALAVPAVAAAGAKEPRPAAAQDGKAKGLTAAKFKEHINARLMAGRAKIEAKMERRGLPEAQRVEIRKSLDTGAGKVQAAVDQAVKDGLVTKEEAKQVRTVAREVHQALREKLVGVHGKKQDKAEQKQKKANGV